MNNGDTAHLDVSDDAVQHPLPLLISVKCQQLQLALLHGARDEPMLS